MAIHLLLPLVGLSAAPAQDLGGLARLQEGRPVRASSNHEDWRGSNVDYKFIRPGETLTLADFKGPGTVRRMWMTVLPSEPGYSRLMTLRIYWDGEKSPSVECPIGDFFGVGHGLDASLESLPVRASADGKARSCTWAMPFRKSARITVTNDGAEATWGFYFNVDAERGPVPKDAPYFHAMYRQEVPCRPEPYLLADIKGRGHYVGTVLSARTTSPGWWGEGDEFFWVDGESVPSLRGTGLEDYFGEAWGLRRTNGAYSGASLFEGGYPGARSTCYRWHVPDPVRFRKGLRVEIEHEGVAFGPDGKDLGNNNERPDEYSSVAFWYQLEPHAPFPALPVGPDRLPFDYRRFAEAEALAPEATAGRTEVAKVPGLRGGAQLEWNDMPDGAELRLPFRVEREGAYQLMALTTRRWSGVVAQFLVDGEPVGGEVSFYSPGYETHREVPFPIQALKAGAHTLSVRCVRKPAEANGRWLAIDGFIVHPIKGS